MKKQDSNQKSVTIPGIRSKKDENNNSHRKTNSSKVREVCLWLNLNGGKIS